MALSPLSIDSSGVVFSKIRKETTNQEQANKINEQRELDQIVAEEDTPASEQWKYLQSTDEMAAALTQFNNRRSIESKKVGKDSIFSSFDAILEEEIQDKTEKIFSMAKSNDVNFAYLLLFSKQMFPDVSDLVLVLREMIKDESLDELLKNELELLLSEVELENGIKVINSGINCALKAKLFGKKIRLSPKFLRVTYREFLFSDDSANDIYEQWITNYGIEKRKLVIEFIQESLLCDISAMDPSCSRIEFGNLLNKINKIHEIKSIETLFITEITKEKYIKDCFPKEDLWIYLILSIIKSPSSIDSIISELFSNEIAKMRSTQKMQLFSSIYRAIKSIAVSMFDKQEEYQSLLDYLRSMIGNNLICE